MKYTKTCDSNFSYVKFDIEFDIGEFSIYIYIYIYINRERKRKRERERESACGGGALHLLLDIDYQLCFIVLLY